MIAPRKAVFLHIQKTAGSSITQMAISHYGPTAVSSHGDFLKTPITELRDKDFVGGHFGFVVVKALGKDRLSFTFLRDPRERIVSQYFFMRDPRQPVRSIAAELAKKLEFDDFLDLAIAGDPRLTAHYFNQQCFQLAHGWGCPDMPIAKHMDNNDLLAKACHNLGALDDFGLVEDFGQDAKRIFQMLGILDCPVQKINASPGRKALSELPKLSLSKVNRLCELDQELYARAKRMRKDRGLTL